MELRSKMELSEPKTEQITIGCGMSGLLETLTRPWTLHIMWLLSTNGPMRFGALRRGAQGISARLLTLRLRTLEEKGFVLRTVKSTNPPQVTYSPTQRLREMDSVMELLHSLSAKWQREDLAQNQTQTKPVASEHSSVLEAIESAVA